MNSGLRVALDFSPLTGAGIGGVESVARGLLCALAALPDGDEEYVVLKSAAAPTWLETFKADNVRTVTVPNPVTVARVVSRVRFSAGHLLSTLRGRDYTPPNIWPQVPVSDGFIESLGCELVHFISQWYKVCALPSLYNPHDLQHLHYPGFFSPYELAWRDVTYRTGCRMAQHVVVASSWIANDVAEKMSIPKSKIQIINWPAPTQNVDTPDAATLTRVSNTYRLPSNFAMYPAMVWQHKNHIRLLEAVAKLRDERQLRINLVCTGQKHPRWWPQVERALDQLNLRDQVSFLGNVPALDLRAVYRLAQFVVIPTLFEAASAPMFEAWLEGVPVTSSNVTSLPEQADGAVLLFNPLVVSEMADSMERMSREESLRESLVIRGRKRLQSFDWEQTARAYRALYRQTAGRGIDDVETTLLTSRASGL